MEPSKVLEQVERLKNSHGYKSRTWAEKKRIVTQKPSIQGQWTPWSTADEVVVKEVAEPKL